MNKKDKNLEKRREFYIPYVSRSGRENDDEIIRESPIIKKTASSKIIPPAPSKPLVSYAESVGYRESPKRYDNLRPKKDIEEERRICYVGITRAKEKLYITYTRTRMQYGKTTESKLSRFISDLDPSCYKELSSKADDLSKEKTPRKKKPKPEAKKEEKYKVGDKILHKVYGKGVVVGYEKESSIKVAFPHPTGIKTLFRDHPSYEKI